MIKLEVADAFNYIDSYGREWEYYKTDFGSVMSSIYKKTVNESNFGRILQHINNGCFMISACRGDNTEAENKKRTDNLANDLRSYNLGYIRVLGGYVEDDKKGNVRDVVEESFFVPQPNGTVSDDEFFNIAIKLCKKYGQDSVLVSMPEYCDFGYYNSDGELDFSPGNKLVFDEKQVGEYFSQLIKGSRRNQKWAFTTEWLAVRHPSSVPQAVKMKQNKENLHLV